MEINAANLAWHKIFCPSQVPSVKNWMKKKKIRWAVYRRNTRSYGHCHPSNNKKSHKVQNENIQRYIPVKFSLKPVKFQT